MTQIREFPMPDLGEGLIEGEILEWYVEVGDQVDLNQMLCQVETAKAVSDVPSPFKGTVIERFADAGEVVEVGKPLVRIEVPAPSEPPTDQTLSSPSQAAEEVGIAPAREQTPEPGDAKEERHAVLVGYGVEEASPRRRRGMRAAIAPARQRPRAKPPVRKLAAQLGVDLAAIEGTGPDGSVTREDVQRATESAAQRVEEPSPAVPRMDRTGFRNLRPGDTIPLRGIRSRIAEKMTESRREIPDATASITVDCTRLWEVRDLLVDRLQEEALGIRISPLVLILRATIVALRKFPTMNAFLDKENRQIHLLPHINLGFAADTERGLLVPVIHSADKLDLVGLAAELERLASAARDGSIKADELTGGTFTVSNYGVFGSDDGQLVINHPESAILGIGAMKVRPWVVDDVVKPRRTVTLTVAFDHRICDGAEGGGFISLIGSLVEQPARLLMYL